MKKTSCIAILLLMFTFLISISSVKADGISISPGSIYLPNVLRGGHAEATFIVGNPNDVPITVSYQIDSRYTMKDWLSLVPKAPFSIDAYSSQKVSVSIDVPSDAPNGNYSVMIIVAARPLSSTQSTGSAVSAAVGISLTVEVTGKQIRNIILNNIKPLPVEVGSNETIRVVIKNNGNVRAVPVIKYEVWNEERTYEYFNKTVVLDYLPPFSSMKYLVDIPTNDLPPGWYFLKISVFLGDKLINTSYVKFRIAPFGTYSIKCNLNRVWVSPNPAKQNEVVRLIGEFNNTGDIPVTLILYGEIKKGDTTIGIVKSESVRIDSHGVANATAYIRGMSPGEYVIKVWGNYNGEKTNTESISLTVNNNYSFSIEFVILVSLVGLLLLIIAVLIAWILSEKRKGRKHGGD
jgi:hypothetical protein